MTSKVKKWIIAIAIAIVFNLFINYGVATFYPGPEYSDYCSEYQRAIPLREGASPSKEAANDCEAIEASQELQNECNDQKRAYIAYKYDSNGCATEAYCETCGTEYNDVRKSHDGNVFVALLIVAVVALAAGVFSKTEAVSIGFLLAGILGLLIASLRYWEHLQNVSRFVMLGIVLAVLVWLGYKKAK